MHEFSSNQFGRFADDRNVPEDKCGQQDASCSLARSFENACSVDQCLNRNERKLLQVARAKFQFECEANGERWPGICYLCVCVCNAPHSTQANRRIYGNQARNRLRNENVAWTTWSSATCCTTIIACITEQQHTGVRAYSHRAPTKASQYPLHFGMLREAGLIDCNSSSNSKSGLDRIEGSDRGLETRGCITLPVDQCPWTGACTNQTEWDCTALDKASQRFHS